MFGTPNKGRQEGQGRQTLTVVRVLRTAALYSAFCNSNFQMYACKAQQHVRDACNKPKCRLEGRLHRQMQRSLNANLLLIDVAEASISLLLTKIGLHTQAAYIGGR